MISILNKKPISEYKFAKMADGAVEAASSSNDNIIGVTDSINSIENSVADIFTIGEIAKIQLGGNVSAGDLLTSNADGNAVKAQQSDNVGAMALEDGENEDVIKVIVTVQRNLNQ